MTKRQCLLPRLQLHGNDGESPTTSEAPRASEGCGSEAAAAVVVSDPTPSTSLPPDLSLVSLQPDLAAWAADSVNGLDSVLQSLLVPDYDWPAAPVDRTCKYRKGKCFQPRTRKKNGDLHSFCEHHRLKSIQNQRKFDQKLRLLRLTRSTKLPESAASPTGADDSDASSSPSSPNEGKGRDTAATLTKSPEPSVDLTTTKKRSRATCAVGDQGSDGTCRCGKKCKDVRYDISFINGAAAIV